MSTLQRLWHPEVHKRYGEELTFYLLDVSPPNWQAVSRDFNRYAQKTGISAYELYQVFGTSDFLLNLWLSPADESPVALALRHAIQGLTEVQPFKVSDTILHWSWGLTTREPEARDLDELSIDRLQDIQNDKRHESPDSIWAEKCGLLIGRDELNRNDGRYVRFAIAIKFPLGGVPHRDMEQVRRTKSAVEQMAEDKQLEMASVYLGYGFASILVVADTKDFYAISELIDNRIAPALGANISTSTYLVSNLDPAICDEIGTATLRRHRFVDPAIKSLFGELYESEDLPRKVQQRIEDWIRQNVIYAELKHEMSAKVFDRFLRGPLLGVKNSDPDFIKAELFLSIARCERYLREHRIKFIGFALGSAEEATRITQEVLKENPNLEASRQPSQTKDVRMKHLSLGALLDVYGRAIKEMRSRGLLDESLNHLTGGWEKAAKLRNSLAHGELEPLPEWVPIIQVFHDFAIRFTALEEIVDRYVADGIKHGQKASEGIAG